MRKRNFKNKIFKNLILVLSVVAITLTTGAFAYLLDADEAVNTFTTGDVTIELSEPEWVVANPSGKVENAIAKQVIPKDPTITNTGVNDAYVYIMVEVPKVRQTNIIVNNALTEVNHYQLFEYDVNPGWQLVASETDVNSEAYNYYVYGYNNPISNGNSVKLFDEITFANITSDFKNLYDGKDITDLSVNVTGYAIQSDFYNGEASDAASAWKIYANQNNWDWPTKPYTGSVEDIEQNNQVYYYKTFNNAITDINANTIGDEAVERSDGNIGVFVDEDDVANIILINDVVETTRSTIGTNLNINLGGHTLTFQDAGYAIDTTPGNTATININGRAPGSKIISQASGSNNFAALSQIRSGYTLNADSVIFEAHSEYRYAYGITLLGGNLNLTSCKIYTEVNSGNSMGIGTTSGTSIIDSCEIETISTSGAANAVIISGQSVINNSSITAQGGGSSVGGVRVGQSNNYGVAEIKDSTFYIDATSSSASAYGVSITGSSNGSDLKITDCGIQCTSNGMAWGVSCSDTDSIAIIERCNITADSQYILNERSYYADGIYVVRGTDAYIRDCYVKGTRCAINSQGTICVDGGEYYGYGYGGLYQLGFESTAKLKNATLSSWSYDGSFDTTKMTGTQLDTALYIEGNSNNTYLHNVVLKGKSTDVVFTDDYEEDGANNLYMSDVDLLKKDIYINSNVNVLYIGSGCNFDESNISGVNTFVYQTGEIYDFEMS